MTINMEIMDHELMDLIAVQAKVDVLRNLVRNDTYVTKRDICNIFGWEYREDKDD